MSRTVIVPASSRLLSDPSTTVLYRYGGGDVLIETNGVAVETGKDGAPSETPVAAGVVLAPDAVVHLAGARDALDQVADGTSVTAYVELQGPADAEMLKRLSDLGVTLIQFVPQHTYLVSGSGKALRAARSMPFVRAVTVVTAPLKGSVAAGEDDAARTDVDVVALAALSDPASLAKAIGGRAGVWLDGDWESVGALIRIPAKVNKSGQDALLGDPRILRVEARAPRRAEDEVAGLILVGRLDAAGKPQGSFLSWLDDHAISGDGVTIGIVDQGVDVTHPAFGARITDLTGGTKDWHGTFVAGHAAGAFLDHKDGNGFVYGIGMAPKANLLAQNNQSTATALCKETVTTAGPSAVCGSIQNNSWGAGNLDPMDYQSQEATYDALVRNSTPGAADAKPITLCFSSGNDGTAGLTRPKAAKNIIVTGNSESYRPDVGGAEADNIREVFTGAHASSHGNCGDGRIRPHVVAPGEWTASANYDSHPGEKEYVDDKITWGGGSSGASPKTAGACALLTQWWRNHDGGTSPSPAMLRALVVNGAEPIDTGGPIPNNVQGWGRLNLDNIVDDGVHRSFVDQTVMLSHRGDEQTWTIRPTDASKPLWITLAWTDPPGAPGTGTQTAPAVVNKLALRATTKSQLFRANQFDLGWSVPDRGDDHEGWDNTQCIHLPPALLGETVDVSVAALDLTMDCLTGAPGTPQQDFALVIRGGFVDRASTPADVFLVIDAAAASAPVSDGDHWASGSSDATEVPSAAPAADAAPAAPTDDGRAADPAAAQDDDAWWNETNSPANETEKAPPPVPSAVKAGAAAGLKIGVGNLASMPDASALQPTQDLSVDLARIDAAWRAAAPGRRSAAVIVVGDATTVSNADVALLRRLSFRGELWLLSSTPSILGFLAQRVHRRTGVHYRLSADTGALAREVRDALVEAAGLQRAVVTTTRMTDRQYRASFDTISADRELVVIVNTLDAGHAALTVTDPKNGRVDIDLAAPPSTFDVTVAGNTVEFRGALSAELAGAWAITVGLAVGVTVAPTVDVYVRSALGVATDHDAVDAGTFVIARGGDAALTHVRLEVPTVTGAIEPGRVQEVQRAVDVSATPSRIDGVAAGAEAQREQPVAALGAVLPTPGVDSGARIVDVPGAAHGILAGQRFARVIRHEFVDLEPRTLWQGRIVGPRTVQTSATVADVERGPGGITALTLARGGKLRRVEARSATLQKLLASVDLHDHGLIFVVRAGELLGIIRAVAGAHLAPATVADEGLVALAGLEPVVPSVEDTRSGDSSVASRFEQAKYYAPKPAGRTINRVVIHITDGGPKVEGTIGWFNDPKKADGSALPVSAHYVVGQDGTVVQMVRESDVAYHANSANGDSIGIEHCARSKGALGANDAGLPPTTVQYAASVALVRDICARRNIPVDRTHIMGHNEADPVTTHTGCPTNAWDWTYYMDQFAAASPQPTSEPMDAGQPTGADQPTDAGDQQTADAAAADTTGDASANGDGPTDGGVAIAGTGGDPGADGGTPSDASSNGDGSVVDGGSDASSGTSSDGSSDAPQTETVRVLSTMALRPLPVVAPASTVPMRLALPVANLSLPVQRRLVLRPAWLGDRVPYVPTIPAPQLGNPVVAGDFLVWPDPPRRRAFFSLARPRLRTATLVVNRATVDVAGGTTTATTGGNAVLTVSAYPEGDLSALSDAQSQWAAALTAAGHPDAATWQFEPLGLKALNGTLAIPAADLAGSISSASASDAGLIVFEVPLSGAAASAWFDRFQQQRGSLIVGTCTLTASYVTQSGMSIEVDDRTLATDLGSLLSGAGPADAQLVDPQLNVTARVIVTAHELVDSVTVDVVPSEGAIPTSLTFDKEGGQATIPISSAHPNAVTLSYNANVRFTPVGWPTVKQSGVLSVASADWDVWVKPDSWLNEYDVLVMLLDDQNHVLAPGTQAVGDVITVRLDYTHPSMSAPLSLTFQPDSQQLTKVPFPNPPGPAVPATALITVMGSRGGLPAGPKSRALTVGESMIVVKAYANGSIALTTNKDTVAESSLDSSALGAMAQVRR